jgi:hypothetical protein
MLALLHFGQPSWTGGPLGKQLVLASFENLGRHRHTFVVPIEATGVKKNRLIRR